MELSVTTISQAGVGFLSLFAGFLKKIAPPDVGAWLWTGLASVIAGAAFVSVKLLAHISTDPTSAKFWAVLAVASIVLGVALCFMYIAARQTRIVEYPRGLAVAGTEFTQAAQKRVREEPNLTRSELLFEFAGNSEEVWQPATVRKSRLILGALYALLIACLAFGLYLAVEVLSNGKWATSPRAAGTTFKQVVSTLKDVHFEMNRSDLGQDASERITDNAAMLQGVFLQFPSTTVIVEGYCDDRGSLEYNLELGYKRALEVRDSLIHAGIPAAKLQVASRGKGSLLCEERDEACRRKNRRAHLTAIE
jgi:outer membrane protein OmpA-like peptidoglycan-associated protein